MEISCYIRITEITNEISFRRVTEEGYLANYNTKSEINESH